MSKDNKYFFHNSDTDTLKEQTHRDTKGDGKLTRNVSEKEYDDEYLRLAIENKMEISTVSIIHGTKEEQKKIDKEMLDFNKKFINFYNPRDHRDEVILINFLHINMGMKLKKIVCLTDYCLTVINEIRAEGLSDCHDVNKDEYKIIWLNEYGHITKYLINFLIGRLNNKVRTDKKIFVIEFI